MNKINKVYFFSGFIISLFSFFVLALPLNTKASEGLNENCSISDQSIDSIRKFKSINAKNIDYYLALLTKAHAEIKCDKISFDEILNNIKSKDLSYDQKKAKILQVTGINKKAHKNTLNNCNINEFEKLITENQIDQNQYLELLREFSINCN
jgi:hypothetical protein